MLKWLLTTVVITLAGCSQIWLFNKGVRYSNREVARQRGRPE